MQSLEGTVKFVDDIDYWAGVCALTVLTVRLACS